MVYLKVIWLEGLALISYTSYGSEGLVWDVPHKPLR